MTREPETPPRPPHDAYEACVRHPYPGDHHGALQASYHPELDGEPDPGEIVWAWVPYEDDHTQGKDRPVLIVGRADRWLLAVALSSQDHDRDAAAEARRGRYWLDIGTGPWDRHGRPSEVRLDRVIRLEVTAMRREGAVIDRPLFERIVRGVHQHR